MADAIKTIPAEEGQETASQDSPPPIVPPARRQRLARLVARLYAKTRRFIERYALSSLSRRIMAVNVVVIIILSSGILYLNQFRAGLINAKTQSLLTQGQIMAAAIASSASVETNVLTVDPEQLLELDAGESLTPFESIRDPLDFPLSPERVAPVLTQLVKPTKTRARLYDQEAQLIIDSDFIYARGMIFRVDLAPPASQHLTWYEQAMAVFLSFFKSESLPVDEGEYTEDGSQFPEVLEALSGRPAFKVRQDANGNVVVNVAVPVQRFRAILGVMMLSTTGDEIDSIVEAEQMSILRMVLVALLASIAVSLLLAATITGPVRKLSLAALQVQRAINSRVNIPNFEDRKDEIGHLSKSLRSMTQALYNRLDAIEAFAADVAHELKNPLTSLRSAVETLPKVKNDDQRKRLLAIIQHDVQRLDRLISDISDASRLDAELAREDGNIIDFETIARTISSALNDAHAADPDHVKIIVSTDGKGPFNVFGHSTRLGQVLTNLIENARSFSPKGGEISILIERSKTTSKALTDQIVIKVEDNGPGLHHDNLERIFERFYTDRSAQSSFGENSGLGLSISKQIIEAHNGSIKAQNRVDEHGEILGAQFVVTLASHHKLARQNRSGNHTHD